MSQLLGQYIGRYHIIEKLGTGGMAAVYKAFDSRLERDVAVKFIRADVVRDEMFLKRFEREAKALARLSHPNIVKVLDYGDHEGMPYLVMEYIRGDTLKGKLGRPIPWRDAARMLLPVAAALDYTHRQNIIHRDVKPSNFLVSESGHLMLSDFGIAKMLDTPDAMELTGTGVGIGTPEYMAPEQGLGQAVDQRADVYSLGIVFYEMLTGQKPYRADTPMAVMFKQISDPLPSPRQYVPSLPDFVEQALCKALAKKPEDRYQDMAAFARALQGLSVTPLQTDSAGTRMLPPEPIQTETLMRETPPPQQRSQIATPPYANTSRQPAQPESWSQPAAPPLKKKSKTVWITCGVVFVVVICIGIFAIAGGFGALADIFEPAPEGLAAEVFVPSTLEMGRDFDVTVTLRNEGTKEIRVNQIQVPQVMLAIARLNRTSPQYGGSSVYEASDSTGFDFDITLAPGTTQSVMFNFTPLQTADVSGEWEIRAGKRTMNTSLRVLIVDAVAQAPTSTSVPLPPPQSPTAPTPAPAAESGWSFVWEDDFSDPESGFYSGENEDRIFRYENGEYKIEGLKQNWMVWVYLGYDLYDTRISIDAMLDYGTGATAYGLFCRYQGDGDFYGFQLSEDGYYSIWLRYDDAYTDLVAWTYDGRLEGNMWRRITAECSGETLSLYLDGEMLAQAADSTLASGDIGLLLETDEVGGAIAAFDNFALYEK